MFLVTRRDWELLRCGTGEKTTNEGYVGNVGNGEGKERLTASDKELQRINVWASGTAR